MKRPDAVLRCTHTGPPLFMPAIYEHKAWFIQDTPSRVSRDVDLFERAVMAEYEQLRPDALVIGMDVYNLEAEAAGCKVTFYEGDDPSIPGIAPGSHSVGPGDDLAGREVPNPLRDGRMPINIEVARRVVRALSREVWVRGAVSGPFSLAVSLIGAEELFLSTLDEPEFARAALAYAGRVIREFGQAYIDVGADVIVFDSQASCDLLSPDMYREFVLPVMKDLIAYFQQRGVRDVPLIIGGNTTPICDALIDSGANNLLCDFKSDWDEWFTRCKAAGRSLRRNMNPAFIQSGTPDAIHAAAAGMIAEAQGYGGFIMGTAVVPYGTPTENLLAVREACGEAGQSAHA